MEVWEVAVAVAGAITALLSAWGALLRTRPGRSLDRWVRDGIRQDRRLLMAEAIDEVLPKYLSPVLAQMIPTMRAELRRGLGEVGDRLEAIEHRLDRAEAADERIEHRLDGAEEQLGRIHAQDRPGRIDPG